MNPARLAASRKLRPEQFAVLVSDRASAPGFRSGRRLRRLSRRNLAHAERYSGLLILCAASTLPAVADVASAANRRHRLRALLIRQDVAIGLIGPLLDRAGVRAWRNVILHQGPPLPARVLNAWQMGAERKLIADVSVSGGVLFVLSCALERLDVPIRQIPALARMPGKEVCALEVSADGSYLHWPKADVHLDLDSLRYAIDPGWRAKADAEAVGRHRRFGEAVRAVREKHSLAQNTIAGLSARHVRRIENGAFPKVETLRLLARAHGMELARYLEELAGAARRLDGRSGDTSLHQRMLGWGRFDQYERRRARVLVHQRIQAVRDSPGRAPARKRYRCLSRLR